MKKSALAALLVMFVSVTAAALAHVSLRMTVVRLGYEMSAAAREHRQLREENRRLRVERSLLRDPARIERLARDKLGMRYPEPTQVKEAHLP